MSQLPEAQESKRCKQCGEQKPIDQFRVVRSSTGRTWLSSYCLPCDRMVSRLAMAKKVSQIKGDGMVYEFAMLKIMQAKSRAKALGLAFDLDAQWMIKKIDEGVCEATGLDFVFGGLADGYRTSPWLPSIDRIDSAKGYTKDNCQVVVVMFNLAKSDWPMDQFLMMARAFVRKTGD